MGPCERGTIGCKDLVVVCNAVLNFVSLNRDIDRSSKADGLFSRSIPSGGISTFGPLIIQGFGYDKFTTILFNMPFGAVQLIATMGGAWIAMVWKVKAPVLMLLSIPPIIGCVMLLAISHDASHRGPLLVGYYLVRSYVYLNIDSLLMLFSRYQSIQASVSRAYNTVNARMGTDEC